MCERARLTLFNAFKNLRIISQLRPLLLANSSFALKFTQAARQSENFSRVRINAHFVEEAAAEVTARFSAGLKAGSFDRVAFEAELARHIRGRALMFAPESIGEKDVLGLIRSARIFGERTLGEWLQAWSKNEDTGFVTLSSAEEAERDRTVEQAISAGEVEGEIAAQRAAAGIDGKTDPDLCG